MCEIKTFIFFDLETTGLPHQELGPTRVTEIALAAVTREQILDKHNGVTKENNPEGLLPRVLHKLNIPVYPCKMIQPMASIMTGLSNEALESQKPFDEDLVRMLTLFMGRCEKPICLVAHNGNKFDFPILKSELTKLNQELEEDIFCADSYPGFRHVLENKKEEEKKPGVSGIQPLNSDARPQSIIPNCGWSQDDYDFELVQVTEVAERLVENCETFNQTEIEARMKAEMDRIRKQNEQTPSRKTRQRLDAMTSHGCKRNIMKAEQKPKIKYNMKSLYNHLTGKELIEAHRAEGDVLAVLECVVVVGLPILKWMDQNRIPFRSVKKMW